MSDDAGGSIARPAVVGSLPALGLSALGVVFGDIGTSPLYTLKTVLGRTTASNASVTLGVLSLLVWTLIVITTIKYVSVAMSVDNDGEGGILALLSLIGVKRQHRPGIIAIGLFGAALIYGDGAITPAISVLSALEGLDIATPGFAPYVLPASVVILIALFTVQPQGTARIGRTFGPIMALWFVTIAVLGIWGVARHPSVLVAINPRYAIDYLRSGGAIGFLVLGAVFLCVTGAEALYADMGHFGARPIRFAWSVLVFPSLVLNYAGQTALLLDGAPVSDNIFYRLCPSFLLVPLIVLATVATMIASQSIITGAFSMTRQAIQLGWLPSLTCLIHEGGRGWAVEFWVGRRRDCGGVCFAAGCGCLRPVLEVFWGSDDGATAAPFFTVLRVPAQSRSGGRGRPRGRRRQRRSGRGRRSR